MYFFLDDDKETVTTNHDRGFLDDDKETVMTNHDRGFLDDDKETASINLHLFFLYGTMFLLMKFDFSTTPNHNFA